MAGKQQLGILTPRELAALLNAHGVKASTIAPQIAGGLEGIDVDLDDLLNALTTLPAEERLPSELEQLLRAARDSYLYPGPEAALGSDTSRAVLFWGGAYLVGLPDDKKVAVKKLWELHAQATPGEVN